MKKAMCEIAAIVVTMIGITGTIGVLFNVRVLGNWAFTYNMALPTAFACILIGSCLTHLLNRK